MLVNYFHKVKSTGKSGIVLPKSGTGSRSKNTSLEPLALLYN
ncbi:MAG: hypothetical protein JWO06_3576 [Bacteroidota bacterium]|nr:hypothetical protein [Bacteroidota bacterium]